MVSIISNKNEDLLNSNNNRSKPKFLRLQWDIVVFRLVVYMLNMIRFNLLFLYKILYIEISFTVHLGIMRVKHCFEQAPLLETKG